MRKASPYIWQHIDYSISILKVITVALILISIIKNEAMPIYYILASISCRIIDDSTLCYKESTTYYNITIYI